MTKIKKTCNCVRSYHITRMVHRNCHKNEDFDLLYNVIELIMNSHTKKKVNSFHFNEKKILLSQSISAMTGSTKDYCTIIDQRQKRICNYILIWLPIYKNWILFRWWDNIFSSPQQMTLGILVDVGRVGSHFIPWQALDLLMVGYVKLGFSWYSWMLHWPLN